MHVKHYESLLYQWVLNEHRGFHIDEYLIKKDAKRILIYGAGVIGECLYHMLMKSKVDVVGFIDNEKCAYMNIIHNKPLYSPKSLPPKDNFDAIVITVSHVFYQVSESLEMKYDGINILSIEDIVFKNMGGDV